MRRGWGNASRPPRRCPSGKLNRPARLAKPRSRLGRRSPRLVWRSPRLRWPRAAFRSLREASPTLPHPSRTPPLPSPTRFDAPQTPTPPSRAASMASHTLSITPGRVPCDGSWRSGRPARGAVRRGPARGPRVTRAVRPRRRRLHIQPIERTGESLACCCACAYCCASTAC
jgi:hypothetical protein